MLGVYARPYDAARPVVGVDEGGKQLIGDVREPLPVRPSSPAKQDHEYQRGGMANLLMAFEPLAGRRQVAVTERKAAADFAGFLRRLSDEWYPRAGKIVLVCDNLNARAGIAVRGVCAGRGAAAGGAVGVAPHAQARVVAQRGGDGVERGGAAVPGPAHPGWRSAAA